MSDTIEQRVARGAAWLDEHRPGWRDQISLDTLNLYCNDHCVMGQVFAEPDTESTGFELGVRLLNRTLTEVGIADLGFNCSREDGNPSSDEHAANVYRETAALVAEWRRVIHASRVLATQQIEVTT